MMYTQALLTSSQTAKCTAQALWDQFEIYYGLPEGIVSDQGQNFESDLISELCKLAKYGNYILALTTHNVDGLIIP